MTIQKSVSRLLHPSALHRWKGNHVTAAWGNCSLTLCCPEWSLLGLVVEMVPVPELQVWKWSTCSHAFHLVIRNYMWGLNAPMKFYVWYHDVTPDFETPVCDLLCIYVLFAFIVFWFHTLCISYLLNYFLEPQSTVVIRGLLEGGTWPQCLHVC